MESSSDASSRDGSVEVGARNSTPQGVTWSSSSEEPPAATTPSSAARSQASDKSPDFPIPAAPSSTTTSPAPSRAEYVNACSLASSDARPWSTHPDPVPRRS
jgi:hypothetical protein